MSRPVFDTNSSITPHLYNNFNLCIHKKSNTFSSYKATMFFQKCLSSWMKNYLNHRAQNRDSPPFDGVHVSFPRVFRLRGSHHSLRKSIHSKSQTFTISCQVRKKGLVQVHTHVVSTNGLIRRIIDVFKFSQPSAGWCLSWSRNDRGLFSSSEETMRQQKSFPMWIFVSYREIDRARLCNILT